MTLNLIIAIILVWSVMMLAARQAMLDPRHVSFPKAPKLVLVAFFSQAATQLYVAAIFYGHGFSGFDGKTLFAAFLLAAGCATTNTLMVINVLQQRRRGNYERHLPHPAFAHAKVKGLR